MKIIWFSRHDPLPSQVAELRRIFGNDLMVSTDRKTCFTGKEMLDRYFTYDADDLVVVSPMHIMAELCALGLQPITALMISSGMKGGGKRDYEFVGFRRVVSMTLCMEELKPKEG